MTKSKTFVHHLCDSLRLHGAITAEQHKSMVEEFSDQARLDFENFLVTEGLVSRAKLLESLSYVYKVPSFDTVGYFFDHYLVTRFDKEFLGRKNIIPLSVDDDAVLIMIAAVPDDPTLAEEIMTYVSWEPTFMVGMYQDIQDAIDEYYDESLTIYPPDEELPDEEREERVLEEGNDIDRIAKSSNQE